MIKAKLIVRFSDWAASNAALFPPPVCCDTFRGLIEDVLCGRASLVSTLSETSHACGGWEVCHQHLCRQLLSSPVCQHPLKATQRDNLTQFKVRFYIASKAKKSFWLKVKICRKKKRPCIWEVSNMFHALHAGHPPAWLVFGFGTTRAALPTSPIIHRVNKNGFGWNRRPVSCLKPTGRMVHNTDSLMNILIFHRSYCQVCKCAFYSKTFDLKLNY